MATLLDLFKSQKKNLYGKSENIRIESRGLINPPRAAALLTSSPNALGDLIGNQIGGALGGSANRPSDTIFRGNSFLSKPISLFRTQSGLKRAIEADTAYYVKKSPAPASLIASFKQGGSSIGGMAANLAIKAITKGGLKKLASDLKDYSTDEQFGPKFGAKDASGKPTVLIEDKKFSTHYKDKSGKLQKRDMVGKGTPWEIGQTKLLEAISITNEEIAKAEYANHVIVTFETIPAEGKSSIKVPFIGAINGISEDVSPSWNSFKYVGSPFNIYRYSGVERSLKFNLKLYYTTLKERDAMIVKINYLKSLAFPDKDIKTITSGGNTSQYAMAPNLVRVSIGSLYKEIPGYIESLGFQIDDNTTWANFDAFNEDKNQFMYPSMVDVSIGLKIIEDHKIESGEGDTKVYRYDFNGQLQSKDREDIKQVLKLLTEMGFLPKK
jgi:hypothetical protein